MNLASNPHCSNEGPAWGDKIYVGNSKWLSNNHGFLTIVASAVSRGKEFPDDGHGLRSIIVWMYSQLLYGWDMDEKQHIKHSLLWYSVAQVRGATNQGNTPEGQTTNNSSDVASTCKDWNRQKHRNSAHSVGVAPWSLHQQRSGLCRRFRFPNQVSFD